MRFGRFWQNWVSSVHTGSETIGLYMEGTVDIGLLYAYGFISLTSKASRPEAKISDCHRCLGAGHEQSMIRSRVQFLSSFTSESLQTLFEI